MAWERGYQLAISLVTNLAPSPITMVIGLGPCMRMRTKLEMASYAMDSSQCVVNGFY